MAFKHLNQFQLSLESMDEEEFSAGNRVKSRSPGSKGWKGKILTIKKGNALVEFDNGKKLAVPSAHLDAE